jgi:PilZ domain
MTDNRRTSTRYDVTIPSKLTIITARPGGTAINGAPMDVTMTNLSLGGALIAGTKQAMGQRLEISFRVPTLKESIQIGGVVRWTDAKGIGIQFDGLRAQEVWALNEYFKQLA